MPGWQEKEGIFAICLNRFCPGLKKSFDFVKFAENIGLPPFSVFNALTGYRPYSHSVRENGSRREAFILLAFFWPGLINPLST